MPYKDLEKRKAYDKRRREAPGYKEYRHTLYLANYEPRADNRTKSPGEASCNALYSHYRTSAKRRNLEFSLTKEEFLIWVTKLYKNLLEKGELNDQI